MATNKTNPFKELQKSPLEAPPDMRQRIMDDVAVARLLMDIAFLFTKNYPSALNGLLRTQIKKRPS